MGYETSFDNWSQYQAKYSSAYKVLTHAVIVSNKNGEYGVPLWEWLSVSQTKIQLPPLSGKNDKLWSNYKIQLPECTEEWTTI